MTYRGSCLAAWAIALTAVSGVALQGCAAVAVGGAATAGVAATEERGFGGAASDTRIRVRINSLWLDADERILRKAELQVYNGRVLLTGLMDDEKMRARAAEVAGQAEGVREVLNEIQIGRGTIAGFARDTLISGELKAKLKLDTDIASFNYSVTTTDSTIFLIGSARSREERDLVHDHARRIPGVKKVVTYVEVAGPARTARQ